MHAITKDGAIERLGQIILNARVSAGVKGPKWQDLRFCVEEGRYLIAHAEEVTRLLAAARTDRK